MSGKEQCPVPAAQKAEPNKTLPNATLAGENCTPELGGFDFVEVEAPNGDSLAAALGVLLAAPPEDADPAQFEAAAQSSIDAYPLPIRAGLWADDTFWQAPFWSESPHAQGLWRRRVDPMPQVQALGASLSDADLAQLCQVPAFRRRLVVDIALTTSLLEGRASAEALGLRVLISTGGPIPTDAIRTVQLLIEGGDPTDMESVIQAIRADPDLAQSIALRRDVMLLLRERDPVLAQQVEAAAHQGVTGQDSEPTDAAIPSEGWMGTAEPHIANLVARLVDAAKSGGAYSDPGPMLLSYLQDTQDILYTLASQTSENEGHTAARVRMALTEAGMRFAAHTSVLGVLDQVEDPFTRRRIAQLLGREGDAVARAGTANGEVAPRQLEHAARLGALLAEAVTRSSQSEAETIGGVFRDLRLEVVGSAKDKQSALSAIQDALRAGYAPIGGSLIYGLTNLEDPDKVTQLIGMRTVAMATRDTADTRSDETIQADFDLTARLQDLFQYIVEGQNGPAIALVAPGPDSLLTPATTLAPDSPNALIARRYLELFGTRLGDHLGDSPLSLATKGTLGRLLGVTVNLGERAGLQLDTTPGLIQQLTPEFFEINGTPIDGCASGPTTDAKVARATQAHVAHLVSVAAAIEGWDFPGGADTEKDLTTYLATLQSTGGKARILTAYAAQTGHRVEFLIARARTRGDISEQTAESASRSIDAGDLHPVSAELRGEADAGQWDAVLATVNSPRFASARSAVLEDGATLAYMRRRAPNADAWDLFYRSATGELTDAELINKDGGMLHDVAEWVPFQEFTQDIAQWAVSTFGHDEAWVQSQIDGEGSTQNEMDNGLLWLLTGDQSERFDVDTEQLLNLRDEGLSEDERETRRAERLSNQDVGSRMESRYGNGDDRYLAEMEMAGRKNQGVALEATTWLWGGLSAARAAILEMSDSERAKALADPVFLDQIAHVTANDPQAHEQLMDLLTNGKDGAWIDALHEAEGSGIDWHFLVQSQEPWTAIEGLTSMSDTELADVANNPTLRQRIRNATERDPSATAQFDALMAAAVAKESVSADTENKDAIDLDMFVERQSSALLAALNQGSEAEVATSLVSFSSALAEQRNPELPAQSKAGWQLAQAGAQMRSRIHEASIARYQSGGASERAGSILYMQLFDQAARGTTGLAVRVLHEIGADNPDALVAVVKAAPAETVAREWASLRRPGRDGQASLRDIYLAYRSAKTAAHGKGPESPEAQTLEDAALALQYHRVDLSDTALDVSLLSRQTSSSTYATDLEELSFEAWEKGRTAVRKRIAALPAALVHSVVGVQAEDADLVWSANMRSGTVVAEMIDRANVSLGETSYLFESVATSDNDAALHYAVFAQQLDSSNAAERSEADLTALTELAAEAQGSIAEYDAARKTAADLASWSATLLATAVAAALTGPGAAPLAAQLVTSAVSGLAGVVIHEAMQGSRYNAEEGLQTLAVDLMKEAVTAGMGNVWTELATARTLHEIPLGRIPRFLHGAQKGAEKTFGKAATSIALAGAAVPWQTVTSSAWGMVEEGVAGRGWQSGLDKGMLLLDAKLRGMPEETARAILAEIASQLGEAAVGEEEATSPSANTLGAGIDSAPSADKTLRTLIRGKLGDVPQSTADKAVESFVSGGADLAFSEAIDFAQRGEHSMTGDEAIGVLTSTVKSTVSTGVKGVGGAVGSGRAAHAAQQQRSRVRASLQSDTTGQDEIETAAFLAWSGTADIDFDAPDAIARARSTFRSQVWDVAEGRLEMQRPEQDSIDFEAYREWVYTDPTKALSRVDTVDFGEFQDRYGTTRDALAEQRASTGFRALTPHEQRWFDHAAGKPWLVADLGDASADLSFRVDSDEDRERFQQGVAKASEALAAQWVRRWAEDRGGAEGAFAADNVEILARRIQAVPGDELKGSESIADDVRRYRAFVQLAENHE